MPRGIGSQALSRRAAAFAVGAVLALAGAGGADGTRDAERLAAFEAAMRGPGDVTRVAAIATLAREPASAFVPALAARIQDPSDAVARASVRAVAWVGTTLGDLERVRAINILVAALRAARARPVVAIAALQSLSDIGDPRAATAAIEQLDAPEHAVVVAAVDALTRLRLPESVEALVAFLAAHERGDAGDPPDRQAREAELRTHAVAALVALVGGPHTTAAAWRAAWAEARDRWRPPALPPGSGPLPPEKPPAAPDPIALALERGADWLLARRTRGREYDDGEAVELLALAYARRSGDPRFCAATERLAAAPLERTYEVALGAMVLERDGARRWQQAIARRAWWLVNAQAGNGAWGYGGAEAAVPESLPRASGTRSRFGTGPIGQAHAGDDPDATLVVDRVVPWSDLLPTDLSNAQIAVLGLHAAERAHVRAPTETWTRIEGAWLAAIVRGGGWGYLQRTDIEPTGGMTAGGIAALAMVREVLEDRSPKRDAAVRAGFRILDRLGPMGEWRTDPDDRWRRGHITSQYFFYWLYSLERAGALWDRSKIGGQDWFAAGSKHLLATQRPDGGWGPADDHKGKLMCGVPDAERAACTAFAVLFLARAVPERRTQITRASVAPAEPQPDPEPTPEPEPK